MDFPLQEALVKGLLSKESWNSGIGDIYRVIANDYVYGNPYNLVVFAGNHDINELDENANFVIQSCQDNGENGC